MHSCRLLVYSPIMDSDLTPEQKQTLNARIKIMRRADEKRAVKMRANGWVCIPPEQAQELIRFATNGHVDLSARDLSRFLGIPEPSEGEPEPTTR